MLGGKWHVIHRLVALAFIPNPSNYDQVNHIDCDKLNNNVNNLEWCNNSMNQLHAYKNGLQDRSKYYAGRPRREVEQIDKDTGEVLRIFPILMSIKDELGLNWSNVRQVCIGSRHTCGGYNWKFHEE